MSLGGVNNGQLANETTFNDSFLTRNGDNTDTVAKVDLLNAAVDSGSSVVNVQKNINSIASALGISTNQAANLVITWANAIVGSSSSSAKDKIEALVNKFHETSGHKHTGVSGDAPKITASDLASFNNLWAQWKSFQKSGVSSTSTDVTSSFFGQFPTGTSTSEGVIVLPPYNRCWIVDSNTLTMLEDSEGQRIYGRLTESAGTWTLSYFTNESGVETAHNITTPINIDIYYIEVFNSEMRPTIPSDPSQYGTLDITADVIDATQLLKGKVLLQNLAASEIGSASTIGTPNGRVSNADHAHKGVHSISILGDLYQAFGDVQLEQGDNIELTWNSGKLKIKSAGGVAFQENPAGTVNGTNDTFGPLTYLPSTDDSVLVFIDYVAVPRSGYTVSGSNIILGPDWIPQLGQSVYAFYITAGLPAIPTVTGTYRCEHYVLQAADITAKQISLALVPSSPNEVSVDLQGGGLAWPGDDFTVSSNVLSWNGLGLDGLVIAGDKMRITYVS